MGVAGAPADGLERLWKMRPRTWGRWDEGSGGAGDVGVKLTFPDGGLKKGPGTWVGDRLGGGTVSSDLHVVGFRTGGTSSRRWVMVSWTQAQGG